jgi:hypothetical protein
MGVDAGAGSTFALGTCRPTVPPLTKETWMGKTGRRAGIAVAAATLVAAGVGGASMAGTASAAPVVHTLKFASITTASHSVGKTTFVGSDVDRRKGKVIGYDSLSGKFNVHTHTATIDVAAAFKGGILYVSGVSTETGDFTGKVTGGTGKYKGAKGTVTGVQVSNKKTNVVVKYHL